MQLTERKMKILQAIIGDFVKTAEPVGSRTLSKRYELGISPATIRNEMSDLEEMGFLTHPHTSAGRVPSEKAYRYYVDEMMRDHELADDVKSQIAERLYSNVKELDKTVEHAAKLLSEITQLTSFAITPKADLDTLRYIRLLPVDEKTIILMIVAESGKVSNTALSISVPYTDEALNVISKSMTYTFKGKTLGEALTTDIIKTLTNDISAFSKLAENIMPNFVNILEEMLNVNLYMDGLTNIFALPEYSDIDKARMFMEMVNKKDDFTRTLEERDDGIMITIGDENHKDGMQDCSVITATYHVDGKLVGKLGVIGPTRMKYSEITSVVKYLTDNISQAYGVKEGDEEDSE